MIKGYITVMSKKSEVVKDWTDIMSVSYCIVDASKIKDRMIKDKGYLMCKAYEPSTVYDLVYNENKPDRRVNNVLQEVYNKFKEQGIEQLYLMDESTETALRESAVMSEGVELSDEEKGEFDILSLLNDFEICKVSEKYADDSEYAAYIAVKREQHLIDGYYPMVMSEDLAVWDNFDEVDIKVNEAEQGKIAQFIEEHFVRGFEEERSKIEKKLNEMSNEGDRVWYAEMLSRRVKIAENLRALKGKGLSLLEAGDLQGMLEALRLPE